MQILDIINASQGGAAAASLARSAGIDQATAERALQALLPRLTQRMERNTLSRGGLADLVSMLGSEDRSAYLSDPSVIGSPAMREDGNAILEQILGSKNDSRKLADRAARETGISDSVLKQLLPMVAAMAMGGLAKEAGGPLDALVKAFGLGGEPLPLPGQPNASRGGGGASGDYGGSARSSAPQRPPLPKGQSPLPIPGDDLPGLGRRGGSGSNPLDDLSDILRRGSGRQMPRIPRDTGGRIDMPGGGGQIELPQSAGGLWGLIRSILGSVLGFESKGFLSWLIRLIVLRWGVGFIKRLLTRILSGAR